MKLEVSLAPSGEIRLHLPSGRFLDLGENLASIQMLKKVLRERNSYPHPDAQPKGYCRSFPTQHVIDKWKREDAAKRKEEAEAKIKSTLGIDIAALDIKL